MSIVPTTFPSNRRDRDDQIGLNDSMGRDGMVDDSELTDIDEWDGAIGPQSEDEPLFYELQIEDETVRLIGPSPGQLHEYDIDEFESLVAQGEWVLADNDPANEVLHTPGGERPY